MWSRASYSGRLINRVRQVRTRFRRKRKLPTMIKQWKERLRETHRKKLSEIFTVWLVYMYLSSVDHNPFTSVCFYSAKTNWPGFRWILLNSFTMKVTKGTIRAYTSSLPQKPMHWHTFIIRFLAPWIIFLFCLRPCLVLKDDFQFRYFNSFWFSCCRFRAHWWTTVAYRHFAGHAPLVSWNATWISLSNRKASCNVILWRRENLFES